MNATDKKNWKRYITTHRHRLLDLLKTGAHRPLYWKESNYSDVAFYLREAGIPGANEQSIIEAAKIFETETHYVLEIEKPPSDNGAARKLVELEGDSSSVRDVIDGIDVRLDVDQLKHQHPKTPIGNRQKGGGTKFKEDCNAQWHKDNTLRYMASWARGLENMDEGDKLYHGQAAPVDWIHYEGYCLMSGGKKYVAFHCYPNDLSEYKLG